MEKPPVAGRGYGVVRRGVMLYAGADAVLRRAQARAGRWAEELLDEALSPEEKGDLGNHLYAASPAGTGAPPGLWPWERAWFQRRLPAAPASVLLGGAGAGREAAGLVELGYRVDAFEPVAALQPRCAAAVGTTGEARVGTYQELARACLFGDQNQLSSFAARRYEAVILGWGSFTHLLEPDDRRQTLMACAALGGDGPILASFWLGAEGSSATDAQATAARGSSMSMSMSISPARRVGRWLGRLRGRGVPDSRHTFATWCGFAHAFSRGEIEALAAAIGRRVLWESEPGAGYPHVTLVD